MKRFTFALHTLGCKVNIYESDLMAESLRKSGFTEVDFGDRADVYIINTCTVTNVADKKSRQMLHRARKKNEDALIVAAGCYVDAAAQNESMGSLLSDGAVDIFIGNKQKAEAAEIIIKELCSRQQAEEPFSEAMPDTDMSELSSISGHTRAFMKIQDGCNQFCTYCIIPYVRGRIHSRGLESIISEAERLASNGIREIVLSGIHLSSYGKDLRAPKAKDREFGEPKRGDIYVSDDIFGGKDAPLITVLRELDRVEGIDRIRLGSLEPRLITRELLDSAAGIAKLCPSFHLALQSGSDSVLRRMKRRYTIDEYRESCRLLREYYDAPTITTDIIVGFPGESEEEFQETMELLKELKLYEANIFKYSRRAGTLADRMPGQIPEPLKAERSERLISMADQISGEIRQSYLGRELEILCEEERSIKGEPYMTGYSREYLRCAVKKGSLRQNDRISGIAKEIFNEKDMDGSILLRL